MTKTQATLTLTHTLKENHILGNIIRCSHASAERPSLQLGQLEAIMAALAGESHAHGPSTFCVSAGLFGGGIDRSFFLFQLQLGAAIDMAADRTGSGSGCY